MKHNIWMIADNRKVYHLIREAIVVLEADILSHTERMIKI